MTFPFAPKTDTQTVTAALAGRVSAMRLADMPPAALTVAKQCLLDWSASRWPGATSRWCGS